MQRLIFALLLLPLPCLGSDWTCAQIAEFHGLVALDRDRGVSLEARLERTKAAAEKVAPADTAVLLKIVRNVYGSSIPPAKLKASVMQQCAGTVRV